MKSTPLTRVSILASVYLAVSIFSSAIWAQTLEPEIKSLNNQSPKNVLFVGNSYLYYNDSIHNHVNRLLASLDAEARAGITYKSATIGGARLSHHNIDSHLTLGKLGLDEPFDLVIMQGGSAEPLNDIGRRGFLEHAIEYDAKIHATGAETALYMTHAYGRQHARFDQNMIRDIESLYIETANQIDALVIPVGLAFEEAYRRRPHMQLHKEFDGSHPSVQGTYLAAAVVLASVYGISPIGSDYRYYGEVNDEDALFLQAVAHFTVESFFNRRLSSE